MNSSLEKNKQGTNTSYGMKLLILTQKVDSTDDNLGFFHRWIEEFAQQCEQVIVICLYEGKHVLPANVRVLSLGKEKGGSRLKYLKRFYGYIWKEQKNYDSVFVHMNQIYVILGGLLWRMLGKQIGLWYAHGKVSLSLRLATLFVHDVFTASDESFRITTKKKHVVGHGIDTMLFVPRPIEPKNNIFRIISVGRISPAKDYETLIAATRIAREAGVPLEVDVVGTPGTPVQRSYLKKLLEEVRLQNQQEYFRFVGPSLYKELPHQLAKAHIFISTSTTRSLDKAPLEAMAMGLLVLSCNEPGVRVMPRTLQETFSFSSHDIQGLAQKIVELSHIPNEERLRIGELLRASVMQNHTLPHVIKRVLITLSL